MEWCDRFKEARVTHLAMINSDHAPILINTERESASKKKTNFKFQVARFTNKGLAKVVENNWNKDKPMIENAKLMREVLIQIGTKRSLATYTIK